MNNGEKVLQSAQNICFFCADVLLILMAVIFTIVEICFRAVLFTAKATCSFMVRFCFAFSLVMLFVLVYLFGLGVSVLMGPGIGSHFS